MSAQPKKLMVRVKEMMETRHYAVSTQKTYRYWILDYIRYHGTQHPATLGKARATVRSDQGIVFVKGEHGNQGWHAYATASETAALGGILNPASA